MWREYYTAASIEEAIELLGKTGPGSRIIAGATDLILEIERGVRKGIDTLIDITRIPAIDRISLDEDGIIHLGPLVTHNQCAGSDLIRERAFPLARAAWEVGAPQIRNRATIAGNLITASPANDTITPLMALKAWVVLRSARGERKVNLRDFYTGVRKTVMEPDEMLVDIAFPALDNNQRGTFIKVALRRAQAISVVNAAVVIGYEGSRVTDAAITLGAVAPTIIHAEAAEKALVGHVLDEARIAEASRLAAEASRPIDDLRGSALYRREMVRVSTKRALQALQVGREKDGYPSNPVMLSVPGPGGEAEGEFHHHVSGNTIVTTINGKSYAFDTGFDKTLLNLIRDEAGLIGSKEGCAEGECGACTVFLDGQAVMACLVPAPRAHGADIVTVEGLKKDGQLHPVQKAFISDGAVQCGYCTPGFLMSAAKLLEENPHPSRNEIEQAITGNLCRCTGYYKIVQAIEDASQLTY